MVKTLLSLFLASLLGFASLGAPTCAWATKKAPEPAAAEHEPATFLLRNRSHRDLVAIRISDGKNVSFARLDLGPGGEDDVENPGGTNEIRLDLGLVLTTWKNVPLDGVLAITLCSQHENCLVVTDSHAAETHLKGESAPLLPQENAKPVCALEGFRAGMTMKDACGLMQNFYSMEEGVYLATLGFANKPWSARLYANTEKGESLENAVLDSVELRQKLTPDNLQAVLESLQRLGYAPWQATFPGVEITFPDMLNISDKAQLEVLDVCTTTFLHQGRGVASIIYAPKNLLATLANEEMMNVSTQLYTVSLHRDSDTLLLDMSAYNVEF